MAVEMLDPDGGPVVLSAAPLVEGAVAAAARARGGRGRSTEVAARGARRAGDEDLAAGGGGRRGRRRAAVGRSARRDALEARLPVANRLGLHARPAARFVGAAGGLDARVDAPNARAAGAGRRPQPDGARGARACAQGDEIVVARERARSAQRGARRARARSPPDNCGDRRRRPSPPPRADRPPPAAARGAAPAGDRLRGAAASPGIALGPARRLETVEPEVAEEPAGSPPRSRRGSRRRATPSATTSQPRGRARSRGAGEAEIFDAHRLLLDDAALVRPPRSGSPTAPPPGAAWRDAAQDAAAAFRALDDAYLRERAVDVEDVARRVLARLAGVQAGAGAARAGHRARGRAHARRGRGPRSCARARPPHRARRRDRARRDRRPRARHPRGDRRGAGGARDRRGHAAGARRRRGRRRRRPRRQRRRRATRRGVRPRRRSAAEALAAAAAPAALADGTRIEVFANLGAPGEARARGRPGRRGRRAPAHGVPLPRARDGADRGRAGRVADRESRRRCRAARSSSARSTRAPTSRCRSCASRRRTTRSSASAASASRSPSRRSSARSCGRSSASPRDAPDRGDVPDGGDAGGVPGGARGCWTRSGSSWARDARLEVGVMVEVPALALAADAFAAEVDFFSVGHERPLPVHDGRRTRERGARRRCSRRPAPSVLALIAARRRGGRRARAAGSASAASSRATPRPPCSWPASACAS